MPAKLNIQDFISKANEIHGSKYDYRLVEYKNNSIKVKVVCKEHGIFLQTPRDHLTGRGCVPCSLERKSSSQRMSGEDFLLKAVEVHGRKYDYSMVVFLNNKSRIWIICSEHGGFEQTLSLHLSGSGCPQCGFQRRAQTHLSSTSDFIISATKKHGNRYSYDFSDYVSAMTPIKIICRKHGAFMQKPSDHLDGHGCAKCAKTVSNMETYWLNTHQIPEESRNISVYAGSRRFYVDGYYNGIIYEFYGDFWHGNPELYQPQDHCKVTKKTFGEMYNKTIERKKFLEEHGFQVVCEWESNFRKTYEELRKCSG